jgi:hypothetical protein
MRDQIPLPMRDQIPLSMRKQIPLSMRVEEGTVLRKRVHPLSLEVTNNQR